MGSGAGGVLADFADDHPLQLFAPHVDLGRVEIRPKLAVARQFIQMRKGVDFRIEILPGPLEVVAGNIRPGDLVVVRKVEMQMPAAGQHHHRQQEGRQRKPAPGRVEVDAMPLDQQEQRQQVDHKGPRQFQQRKA